MIAYIIALCYHTTLLVDLYGNTQCFVLHSLFLSSWPRHIQEVATDRSMQIVLSAQTMGNMHMKLTDKSSFISTCPRGCLRLLQ